MNTIDDILTDKDYSLASIIFSLLHDHPIGVSIPIELPHARLLTFIQRFHDVSTYQQYINNNRQKMMTLFLNNNKLLDWDRNRNDIDHNLCDIFVFCDTFRNYLDMNKWKGCYRERIRKVFMHDKLDYQLLYVGLDYLITICEEFHEDDGLREKFCADGRRIAAALGDRFGQRATKLSREVMEHEITE
jgi:hypothetical protein